MRMEDAKDILREVIACPNCGGSGFCVGVDAECPECGGDGHRLHGMEGHKLLEIIANAFKGCKSKKESGKVAELKCALEEITTCKDSHIRCCPSFVRDIALNALWRAEQEDY